MGKRGKNKINKGTPKAEFPPLRIYLEDTTERAYVKIPIDEVVGKSPRLCIFIGVRKTWETDVHSLTNNLEVKRKSPIDFAGEGKCWAFYFDEDAGNLYNEYNDPKPILELYPAPKQEYIYAKVDKSSKPGPTENSEMSNSSVSFENKEQEKPIHNSTSVIKKEKRKESILSKKKGNERAPKELPTVNKKTEFVAHSNTSIIKGQNEDKDDITPKIEKEQGNNADELLKKAQELETKGKKKESFLLLKKAADCGSERAKAELGQKYLKLAIKYLGRDVAFEKLGAKVTSSRKGNKTETLTAPQPHFRHQRNRIAELNGCGDMAETETSVLHAEKAEETTWVGEEKKDNPPPPEVIIQEIVRYVAYWSGTDCLPNLMFVDCPEPEVWECTSKCGQEFSETSVMMLVDCTAVTRKEEAPLPMPSEEKQKDQASKPSIKDSFYRVFRNIFTIFKR